VALVELYQEDRELVPRELATWNGYVLSGWWRRVGAAFIDACVPVAIVITLTAWGEVGGLFFTPDAWLATVGAVLASLAYFPVIMRATNGRTLGKMATRIRVVRTDDQPMSFVRATWREVVLKTLAVGLIPPALWPLTLLDDLWPLWDPENRAIHDMLAGTRVVRADMGRA
jgi:uncharacterized RDD family membrane protein YckC